MGEREFGEVLRFPGPKKHSPNIKPSLVDPSRGGGA